jgi:hypothetical protein
MLLLIGDLFGDLIFLIAATFYYELLTAFFSKFFNYFSTMSAYDPTLYECNP